MARTPTGIVLRPALPSDAAIATAIASRAKATWGYPPEWLAAWQQELTFTAAFLERTPAFMAELGGIPVGIGVLQSCQNSWELSHLWVDPPAQRRGVGRALLGRVGRYMREHAIESSRILSDPFAEPFYLREGARRIGEVPSPMPGAAARTLPLMEWPVPADPD